ncbi:hypothetical protein B0I37DRAFT_357487 [Chaetomium sp. MPI-CAGE-AT-0009]|nr:hypothetical protein B0I37DRAFT_357487 [Chaetomium sp. MPI-CAGE-AT-0009]
MENWRYSPFLQLTGAVLAVSTYQVIVVSTMGSEDVLVDGLHWESADTRLRHIMFRTRSSSVFSYIHPTYLRSLGTGQLWMSFWPFMVVELCSLVTDRFGQSTRFYKDGNGYSRTELTLRRAG